MLVHSSNGDIGINDEGVVQGIDLFDGCTLPQITKFDLDEYFKHYPNEERGKVSDFDILDLGYWYIEDGETKYEPPVEDFRNKIKTSQSTVLLLPGFLGEENVRVKELPDQEGT